MAKKETSHSSNCCGGPYMAVAERENRILVIGHYAH
jgi:hypothetical protein